MTFRIAHETFRSLSNTYPRRYPRKLHIFKKAMRFLRQNQQIPSRTAALPRLYSSSAVEPSPLVEAECLAVAVAHMPAPSAIPGNLAQVMHMIHWTLPRPRFKILFVLAAPCPKPVWPERDRRKAPSSALSVNELAAFDRGPTHETAAMPLAEVCIFNCGEL